MPAPGTAGGGPAPASDQPAILGTHILNPPDGEVKEITLPDGSKLVPLARVLPNGDTAPLTAAPLAGRRGAASGGGAAPAPALPATLAPSVSSIDPAVLPGVEPDGFLYNDHYYAKFHRAEPIDLADREAVDRRLARSTIAYLQEEEPELADFGVTDVRVRRATTADADLLRVNPRAHWIADVSGVTSTGMSKSIPSVMNADGAVFVDPRAIRI